ncbi:nitrile hydratase subunit beta [Chelatococcus reniformis]|uniref:Nitrile hydratase subunit beta n=1 Tax=Chelatococcus reniformis TaxID=1494448 RepID=A0A916UTX4_9HYPH|nr:nitrile hydratase subunit beta [Chelatococcus reniformis]GGC86527.1 nitrile hydratase [Chelatococcus reniformis]
MNGAQDMGGMMGFGPVMPEDEAVRFHAPWERRALALTVAVGGGGVWNIDASRHMRESLHPADYLASSYYEIWTKGLERLLLAHGLVTAEELAQGRALEAPRPIPRVLSAEAALAAMAKGSSYDRPVATPARFAVGDRLRAREMNPRGHTRLPRYARGKLGTVEIVHGGYVLPDTHAHGQGENPQWLYCVRFSARELWGPEADPSLAVSIDAWESYLEPATP